VEEQEESFDVAEAHISGNRIASQHHRLAGFLLFLGSIDRPSCAVAAVVAVLYQLT
jgi:hypothetical protein